MPKVVVPAGEETELATLGIGESLIAHVNQTVRFHERAQDARRGWRVPKEADFTTTASKLSETVYVRPEGDSDVLVDYAVTGLTFNLFNFEVQRGDTEVVSHAGVAEVNATQTTDVNNGGVVTTTVRAAADDRWRLRHTEISIPAAGGGSAATHNVTIQTEAEGIELAFGERDEDEPIGYVSGAWNETTAPGVATFRDNLDEVYVNETSGLEVVYEAGSGVSHTEDRSIRFQFTTERVSDA